MSNLLAHYIRTLIRAATLTAISAATTSVATAADIATFSEGLLSIPAVRIESEIVQDVELRYEGDLLFSFVSMGLQLENADPVVGAYRAADRRLTIATLRADDATYTNLVFQLQSEGLLLLLDANTPLPVASTSYENRETDEWLLNIQHHFRRAQNRLDGWATTGYSFLDIDGDGDDDLYASVGSGTDTPMPGEFYINNGNGDFIFDNSLFEGAPPELVAPRKSIVADFNNDSRPDIFIAGHGFDQPPYSGESPWIILSRADGKYKSKRLDAFSGFNHGAAAGDIDDDGDIDVFMTRPPVLLENLGDGSFIENTSITAQILEAENSSQYYTTEMFDVNNDGYIDILVAGHEWSAGTRIYWGNADHIYGGSTLLPPDSDYGVIVDIHIADLNNDGENEIVLLRTGSGTEESSLDFYQGYLIQIVNLNDMTTRTVATSSAENWIIWIETRDFNNDGYADIYVTDKRRDLVWLNDGAGNFSSTSSN